MLSKTENRHKNSEPSLLARVRGTIDPARGETAKPPCPVSWGGGDFPCKQSSKGDFLLETEGAHTAPGRKSNLQASLESPPQTVPEEKGKGRERPPYSDCAF